MWCAFAGDLPGLLIGRSIQAAGACTFAVLSRAIARDLFDGQALAKTMASITIATAAAPGFSPSWAARLIIYSAGVPNSPLSRFSQSAPGRRIWHSSAKPRPASDSSLHPLSVAGPDLGLVRDARFAAPARTAGLMMAGLFAVFFSRRACFSKVLACRRSNSVCCLHACFPGVGAGMLAPRLSAWFGRHCATLVGLGLAFAGGMALLLAVLLRGIAAAIFRHRFIFLFGLGIVSPLSRAAALSPFGDQAGAAAALFGSRKRPESLRGMARSCPRQRPGRRAWSRAGADVSSSAGPAWVETADGSNRRRFFHGHRTRGSTSYFLRTKCVTPCDRATRRRHRRDMVAQLLRGRSRNNRCIPLIKSRVTGAQRP